MKVEVWSDVVCPFCYIGKRNYENALAQFAEKNNIEIVWKSFQLDPTVPKNIDTTYVDYLAQKKGMSKDQTLQMMQQVEQMAKNSGLEYHLENSKIINTFELHKIIQMAKTKGLGDVAEEVFFKAYFTDAKNLSDNDILETLALEIGLTKADFEEALDNKIYEEKANADIQEAAQIGVTGVPFFVFNRKYAISGAQPVEAFLQTIEQSYSEWKKENPTSTFEVSEGTSCSIDGNCN